MVAAFVLAERRDLGAGLFADRVGPSRASSTLRHPLGLAWRIQRGVLLWWGVVFVGLGILLGAIVTSVGGMLDSDQARQLVEQLGREKTLNDAFLAGAVSRIQWTVSHVTMALLGSAGLLIAAGLSAGVT